MGSIIPLTASTFLSMTMSRFKINYNNINDNGERDRGIAMRVNSALHELHGAHIYGASRHVVLFAIIAGVDRGGGTRMRRKVGGGTVARLG
jgi:hypothetical protein